MPDFSDALDAEDPALLEKLRTLLHGRTPRPCPSLDERFGGAVAGERRHALPEPAPSTARPGRRIRRPVTT